ncbi:MAG: hypothetical protein J7L15_08275 [Clostridiales bacterium]|nr:hypothetical protein [Clostridiales bacterium]
MKNYNKITLGYVIQEYAIINKVPTCISQNFVAGDVDYEDMDGENITGKVDTLNEQYQVFDMIQPKHINPNALKFVCPSCGENRLECVMDGSHTCEVTNIDPDGDFDYGQYESNAYCDRFQCLSCGYELTGDDGTDIEPVINDNIEVVEWIKKHC